MKNLILGLSFVAFLASGTVVFATTNPDNTINTELQDVKKKSKATKKTAYGSEKDVKKDGKKAGCQGDNDILKKKNCCDHGKATTDKAKKPEKK
ncbi:MAG: hypothetical protein B7C24_08370 [Bacteroidetes bacterium 4572_77]|nr:MAG: hypothetical protein B7C24_08370 [Bacteroidetes bacterium 4572_77]